MIALSQTLRLFVFPSVACQRRGRAVIVISGQFLSSRDEKVLPIYSVGPRQLASLPVPPARGLDALSARSFGIHERPTRRFLTRPLGVPWRLSSSARLDVQ
jgi:hypothetical protein